MKPKTLSVVRYGPVCEACNQRIPVGELVLNSGVYQCAPCVFNFAGDSEWSPIVGLAAVLLEDGPDAFDWEWTVP